MCCLLYFVDVQSEPRRSVCSRLALALLSTVDCLVMSVNVYFCGGGQNKIKKKLCPVRLWWGSGGVDRARTFPSEFTQNNFAEYGKSFLTPPPPDPSVFQTSHVDVWRAFFEGIFRFAMSPTLPIPLFPLSFHITPFWNLCCLSPILFAVYFYFSYFSIPSPLIWHFIYSFLPFLEIAL